MMSVRKKSLRQDRDEHIRERLRKNIYQAARFYEWEIVTYKNKIVIPKQCLKAAILWFHHVQGHSGAEQIGRAHV